MQVEIISFSSSAKKTADGLEYLYPPSSSLDSVANICVAVVSSVLVTKSEMWKEYPRRFAQALKMLESLSEEDIVSQPS